MPVEPVLFRRDVRERLEVSATRSREDGSILEYTEEEGQPRKVQYLRKIVGSVPQSHETEGALAVRQAREEAARVRAEKQKIATLGPDGGKSGRQGPEGQHFHQRHIVPAPSNMVANYLPGEEDDQELVQEEAEENAG